MRLTTLAVVRFSQLQVDILTKMAGKTLDRPLAISTIQIVAFLAGFTPRCLR
jgi:hypothetical protein